MTTIYRFEVWDVTNDLFTTSKRWATKEAIERVHGQIIGQGVECADEFIGREIAGMTDRGFDPRNPPRRDFGGAPR